MNKESFDQTVCIAIKLNKKLNFNQNSSHKKKQMILLSSAFYHYKVITYKQLYQCLL